MNNKKVKSNNPISPHLSIYKWSFTMIASIAHRISGVIAYIVMLPLSLWLICLACYPEKYLFVQTFINSFLGKAILFTISWALILHLLGGIRHIIFDYGYCFDYPAREYLTILTLLGSIIFNIFIWLGITFFL